MKPLFKNQNNKLQCLLCPHFCIIAKDHTGLCRVRQNTGNEIKLITYGIISGAAVDPVEKKPLYHFYPGRKIYSIGSFGCNLKCDYCQNYNISQAKTPDKVQLVSPLTIVENALKAKDNIGIAFTYNEPVIMFEYMKDIAVQAHERRLKTVIVSNGFVNPQPLAEMTGFIDAFNIDLKAFNNNFYRKIAGAELKPVLKSLKQIAKSGRHIEITTLIIPGLNDSEEEMKKEAVWIADELGKNIPLHLSRYFPAYRRDDPPTLHSKIFDLYQIASEYLDNVYTGNMQGKTGQNTKCSNCNTIVTTRSGYNIRINGTDENGCCLNCGSVVYKHFIS